MNISEMMSLAIQYQKNGHLPQAEEIYHEILRQQPHHSDAIHFLGVMAAQRENYEQARLLITQAIQIDPQVPNFYNSLGNVLFHQRQLHQAVECYQRALALDVQFFDAYNNLGNVLKELGQLQQAIVCYQNALASNPNFPEAYHNLGIVWAEMNHPDEAINCFQKALALDSNYVQGYKSLGELFIKRGQLLEGIGCLQKALTFHSHDFEILNNLATAFHDQGNFAEAEVYFRKALLVKPDSLLVLNNFATLLTKQNQLTEAKKYLQHALVLNPQDSLALNNLGTLLRQQGHLKEALECYHQALVKNPHLSIAINNLLYTLNFFSGYEDERIFLEHQKFTEHCQQLCLDIAVHTNLRDPDKRLKIAYVSPDFRQHSVSYFIEPILAHHDQAQFEIFCYHTSTLNDETTERLKSYAKHWIECAKLTDEELAQHIRQAGIDILVDLAGHTAYNRLLTFARKPAPLQVTYLGYPNTTGLSTIDYRLTDHYVDCEEVNAPWSVERPLKLPTSLICYAPPKESPEVNDLPALEKGYITFASFNNYPKMDVTLLRQWSEILHQVPHAKLLIKTTSFGDPEVQKACLEHFTTWGIASQRLIFMSLIASKREHLETYYQVDIALDTFPYHGTTTTCEALWMGVPVITLVGKRYASRMGLSILSTLGLTPLIAYTPQKYVDIAVNLAHNLAYLRSLRNSMRQRMQTSLLLEPTLFTHHLERVYRDIWKMECFGWDSVRRKEMD